MISIEKSRINKSAIQYTSQLSSWAHQQPLRKPEGAFWDCSMHVGPTGTDARCACDSSHYLLRTRRKHFDDADRGALYPVYGNDSWLLNGSTRAKGEPSRYALPLRKGLDNCPLDLAMYNGNNVGQTITTMRKSREAGQEQLRNAVRGKDTQVVDRSVLDIACQGSLTFIALGR